MILKEDKMKKKILELIDINIKIDNKEILKDINCTIEEGDFIIIVGGNGAGKSTFFDTLSGKHIPTSGNIIFKGKDITTKTEIERTSAIARIFQNTYLNCAPSLSVLENFALIQLATKKASLISGISKQSIEEATALLNEIGMNWELLPKKMIGLSGGQRQLIAFMMVTKLNPELLLLDEPTAALDPQSSTKLLFYTKKFIEKNKKTALLITHDPQIALHMGNKIWILDNGRIIKQYNEEDKKNIQKPEQLIGQIDYQKLKE